MVASAFDELAVAPELLPLFGVGNVLLGVVGAGLLLGAHLVDAAEEDEGVLVGAAGVPHAPSSGGEVGLPCEVLDVEFPHVLLESEVEAAVEVAHVVQDHERGALARVRLLGLVRVHVVEVDLHLQDPLLRVHCLLQLLE